MSIIRVTGDLNYNQWIVDDFITDPRNLNLQIGFKSIVRGDKFIEFVNLKFGFFLYENDNVIQQGSFPPVGIQLLSSDQDYIEQIQLAIKPNCNYRLHIWAENSGVFYDHKITLDVPKYQQPYPSWVWNGTDWEPPTPYPDDDELYVWDENIVTWVIYDPALTGTLPD